MTEKVGLSNHLVALSTVALITKGENLSMFNLSITFKSVKIASLNQVFYSIEQLFTSLQYLA